MMDEMQNTNRRWAMAALFIAIVVFFAIYLPDIGRGFFKDDFAWIYQSRVRTWGDFFSQFSIGRGFYRPLVAFSFSIDYALFGLRPLGYGLTNIFILLAAALALYFFARRLGLAPGMALLTMFLWVYNHHGISMALLWISGRTSLLLSLFSLLAALAVLRQRRIASALLLLLALFSKEDALLLPLALFCIIMIRVEGDFRQRFCRGFYTTWHLAIPVVIYLILRFRTTAFLPFSAPSYYRFDLSPLHLLRNVLEYLDRSSTLSIVFLALAVLLLRRLPRPETRERHAAWAGLVWMTFGLGLAIFLPIRSSLYAVYPSIGAALTVTATISSLWRAAAQPRRRQALLAMLLLPFFLYPFWHTRNGRWTRDADASARIVRELAGRRQGLQVAAYLILHDRSPGQRQLSSIFGTLVQDAARLCTGNDSLLAWLDPPPPGGEPYGIPPLPAEAAVVHLAWQNGSLRPLNESSDIRR